MVNINRIGYRHTPFGWIPEQWGIKELQKVAEIQQGISKGKILEASKMIEMPYMRVANIKDGFIDLKEVKKIKVDKNEYHKYLLKKDDILITEGGDPDKLGRGAKWNNEVVNCIFQNHLFRIRPLTELLTPEYFFNYLQGKRAKTYFLNSAKQTTGIASINSTQVKEMPVLLPTKREQERIAAVLSTWDYAISKLKEFIALLQKRNNGLMQQMLTSNKRLRGFSKPWKEIQLSEAFNERNETGYFELDLLSVGSLGVYPQSQSEKRDTSNSDKAKYRRICPGDIGYNTMRMWQGRSALSNLEGIVSPAYTIVTPKDQQLSKFYAYLFKLPSIVNKFFRNSQGLVEDTLNCKFKDFSIVKVNVPEYEEQIAIAIVLDSVQLEVKTYEQKLLLLQQQKKGLIQKMLTGEIRVSEV